MTNTTTTFIPDPATIAAGSAFPAFDAEVSRQSLTGAPANPEVSLRAQLTALEAEIAELGLQRGALAVEVSQVPPMRVDNGCDSETTAVHVPGILPSQAEAKAQEIDGLSRRIAGAEARAVEIARQLHEQAQAEFETQRGS